MNQLILILMMPEPTKTGELPVMIWLFGSCYAKLLATLTKQYHKMYQQISKSAVRVDI